MIYCSEAKIRLKFVSFFIHKKKAEEFDFLKTTSLSCAHDGRKVYIISIKLGSVLMLGNFEIRIFLGNL